MYDYMADGALPPNNDVIKRAFIITEEKLKQYTRVLVALSGGADSDTMLDIIEKCKQSHNEIYYTYYNTGLDYDATRRHIKYLEEKYGITITHYAPKKSIPMTCKVSGQPFLTKKISEYVYRLQKHNFQWEDGTYEELSKKYPKCLSALKWWCNDWGDDSQFNINRRKWLREYMILNHPNFKVSAKCCEYAKKNVAKAIIKEYNIELECTGVRRAEKGARATAYKNCFSETSKEGCATYRPLFYFTNEDRAIYKRFFHLTYSDCYEKYGMTRTGCPACPFAGDFDEEREIIRKFEPKFFKAVDKIFGDAFEYQRGYYAFRDKMNAIEKEKKKSSS